MTTWMGDNAVFTLALLIGGLAGAFIRAIWSPTQETWSPKTASDLVIGAIAPSILPYLPGLHWVAWNKVPGVVLLILAAGVGLSATWAATVIQWTRRLEPPAIKNGQVPIKTAGPSNGA